MHGTNLGGINRWLFEKLIRQSMTAAWNEFAAARSNLAVAHKTDSQYNPPVRKFLIIFLLAWMPTQLTWAAVSVYCKHEPAQSSQSAHPGHHEHEHNTPVDSSKPADTGAAHPDCSVCHTATTLPGTEALVRMGPAADALPYFVLPPFPVPPPGAPDRPNWRAA